MARYYTIFSTIVTDRELDALGLNPSEELSSENGILDSVVNEDLFNDYHIIVDGLHFLENHLDELERGYAAALVSRNKRADRRKRTAHAASRKRRTAENIGCEYERGSYRYGKCIGKNDFRNYDFWGVDNCSRKSSVKAEQAAEQALKDFLRGTEIVVVQVESWKEARR